MDEVIVFVLVYYTDQINYYCGYSVDGVPTVSRNFFNAAMYHSEDIANEVNQHLNHNFIVEQHGYYQFPNN